MTSSAPDPAVPSREAPLDRAVAAVLAYYQTEAAVADPRESLEEGLRRTLVASGLPAEVERLTYLLEDREMQLSALLRACEPYRAAHPEIGNIVETIASDELK